MRLGNCGAAALVTAILFCTIPQIAAQQKGQYLPAQFGLNAGVLPDPSITYANMTINYSADRLNNSSGNATPVTGSYDIWAVENLFFYVPNWKVLNGKLAFLVVAPTFANGAATAPQFGVSAGGYGVADMLIQP